ncbi:hypothetical protein FACS1894216_10640 [Synergistales bacterium]|nr:hypothetical protein FACS1894216_10640 [Synergistales bacterium]
MIAEGLPDWLIPSAVRSLSAVYEHMESSASYETKRRLITVVTDRLLAGYSVQSVLFDENGDLTVRLTSLLPPPEWSVRLVMPKLPDPVSDWFSSDTSGIVSEAESIMSGVPLEALSWGDSDIKSAVEGICGSRLPGWRTSIVVRSASGDDAALEISFVPEQPLVLAVTHNISSASMPVMLHSRLKGDLLKGFSPLIGLPVPWVERHREDVAILAKGIVNGDSVMDYAKTETDATIKTDVISEVDIDVESKRYAAWAWMAAYAGRNINPPEVGIHLGRRAQLLPHWDMELYGELILLTDGWSAEPRLGLRWSPWGDFWAGGEWSGKDETWWLRVSVDARIHKPYAWMRFGEYGELNGAVGYRINSFMSIEAHYDSRNDDNWSIRAIVNM